MKEMTTAEFAKANLAALEEPVKVRRYTKSVGTYYPEGYIATLPGPDLKEVSSVLLAAAQPDLMSSATARIEELEGEVKRLKKELASRPLPAVSPIPVTKVQHPMKDVFAGLAKQDREFFERKLGKAKK